MPNLVMLAIAQGAFFGSSSLTTLASAELFLLLLRSSEIKALAKSSRQRTQDERKLVERGLARSVVLDVVLFAPASVILALIILKPLVPVNQWSTAADGLLGIASYGFPYAAVRALVTRVALKTLHEFALITVQAGKQGEPVIPGNPAASSDAASLESGAST